MEFLAAITTTICQFTTVPIGRQLSYLIYYDSNLHSLENQIEKLVALRVTNQSLADAAERQGDIILPSVCDWLRRVDGINEDFINLFNDEVKENQKCFNFNNWCPDLISRHQVSRKAKKKTSEVVVLLRDGNFNRVSYPASPPPVWSTFAPDLVVFESRKSQTEEVMKSLKDDSISIIGVYGIGGIGKTTLVKEVAKKAGEQKLFDEIVMAVVSQTPDVRKIQGEIADALKLKFEEESESGRARRLWQILKKKKSVLVIFDDLWKFLELCDIGIPNGNDHKGCKIVLTSRNQDVCNQMRAQKIISINILSPPDAWNLFRKMAGDTVDSPELHPIASKVVEECAGLPIAIITVARALGGKGNYAWSNALRQLQNPTEIDIPGMHSIVYKSLELSYNFLESDDYRSCFLLCCLFKEDADISIRHLVRYGRGLKLFQSLRNLEEARDKTRTLVNHLKTRGLLLDGINEESIRMHDVIRDFSIWKASSGEHVFWVRHDVIEWTNQNLLDHYTGISLLSNNINELPDGLDCPKLQILALECHSDSLKIPENFFDGIKELRVLDMRHMPIPLLSPLVQSLKKLRTLCLHHCKLRDVSSIGEMTNLEVLSFFGSNVQQLPREIGQLTHLRLLDLTDCEELAIIPPNVISSLSRLECLYMWNSFVHWAGEGQDREGSNATLAELRVLSNLCDLEIEMPDIKLYPTDLLLENLTRFKVSIGTRFFGPTHYYSFPKTMILKLDQGITLQGGINILLKRAQHLILQNNRDVLINVLYDLKREGFANLKCLKVSSNNQMEYLVDTMACISPGSLFPILETLVVNEMGNLKQICHGDRLPTGSFSKLRRLTLRRLPELINLWNDLTGNACLGNLRTIDVDGCVKLKRVFLHHTARYLRQLQSLTVHYCVNLEEIFANDGEGVDVARSNQIVLPEMKTLILSNVRKLRSFFPETDGSSTSDGSLDASTQPPLFNGKVVFPALETLNLQLSDVKEIWHQQLPAESFCRITSLDIKNCNSIVTIFPSNMLPRLQNLVSLTVEYCDLVEEVCEVEGLFVDDGHNCNNTTSSVTLLLPRLTNLSLRFLTSLEHMWYKKSKSPLLGYPLSLQNLNAMVIENCNCLRYLFSLSASKGLIQLQSLEIRSCEMMTEVIATERGDIEEEATCMIVFPSLKTLIIKDCPQMKTFSASAFIEKVDEERNRGVIRQFFFSEKVTFPKLEKLQMVGVNTLVEMCPSNHPENSFCNLQKLHVENCKKLLNVGLNNMLPRLLTLEKLYIEECGLVEEPFIPQDPIAAVSLSNLRKVTLRSISRCWQRWWDKVLHRILPFQNLSFIDISGFDNLNYFFSSSATRHLGQLQTLKIHSCEPVREIVAIDRSGEEEPAEETVFPQLQTLELKDLPNIMSFFSRSCTTFKWPYLKRLLIAKCPKMKTFSTILSQQNPTNGEEGSKKILALPTRPFFNEKVFLPSLEELVIDSQPRLKEIWHNHLPADQSFRQLSCLVVKNCEKLVRVFPSSLLPRLQSLDELRIKHCDSLETVLEGGEDPTEKVVFPGLRYLELVDLSNLGSFCWGNHSIECPILDYVRVEDCPNMRTFSSGLLITPRLKNVTARNGKPSMPWKGDLNSTIQHFFKEEETAAKQEETEEEETSTAQAIHSEILEETKD